jgi:hypothetical protein
VTNWLADPTACVLRIKNNEGGCIILTGRNEVMSRSTRVFREVEGKGTRRERTVWSAGNISVEREGQDARRNATQKANLRLTVHTSSATSHSTPALLPAEAILASDVLRAAAVNAGGSGCGGRTLLELMWDELDIITDRLMTGQEAEDGRDPGRAEGMAYAIAVMQNPYRPSWEAVRDQAVERWEEANPDE